MRSFTLEPLPPETTPQASRVPRKTWDRAPKPIYMLAKLDAKSAETRRVRIGLASGGLGIHRSVTWPKRLQRWEVSHIHSGLTLHSASLLYWEAKRLLDVALLLGLAFGVNFEKDSLAVANASFDAGVLERDWRYYFSEAVHLPREIKAWQIAAKVLRKREAKPFPDHSPEQRG